MNTLFFDGINSFYDLNLILHPFEFPPAEPKTSYLEIPGADGDIDMTESFGEIKYKSRSASAVFSVLPSDDWEDKKTQVSNILNGKKFQIYKSSEPKWYFEGRCAVKEYKCDKFNRTITVDMHLQPFKIAREETVIEIPAGVKNMTYFNNWASVVPYVECENNTSVTVNGVNVSFGAGKRKLNSIVFKNGENVIVSPGTYKIIFTFRERRL